MKLIDEVNVLAEGLCQDYALEHRFRFEPMFKYTRRTDLVHWLENSTVRLSSLQSYADDSTVGGVGDPMEVLIGGLSAELKDPANPGYETVRHNLEKLLGMRVQSGGTLKVTTMTKLFLLSNLLLGKH